MQMSGKRDGTAMSGSSNRINRQLIIFGIIMEGGGCPLATVSGLLAIQTIAWNLSFHLSEEIQICVIHRGISGECLAHTL